MKELVKEVSQKIRQAKKGDNALNIQNDENGVNNPIFDSKSQDSPLNSDANHKSMKTEIKESVFEGKNSKTIGIIKAAISKMKNKSKYNKLQNLTSDVDTDTEALKSKQEYEFELNLANKKLNETRQLMTENLNIAMKDITKLDRVANDVDFLSEKGLIFKRKTQQTHLWQCYNNKKYSGFLYFMGFIFIGIIVLLFVALFTHIVSRWSGNEDDPKPTMRPTFQ